MELVRNFYIEAEESVHFPFSAVLDVAPKEEVVTTLKCVNSRAEFFGADVHD